MKQYYFWILLSALSTHACQHSNKNSTNRDNDVSIDTIPSSTFAEIKPTITIKGTVPFGSDAKATLHYSVNGEHMKATTAIINQKFEWGVDSLDNGFHAIVFHWPKLGSGSSIIREIGQERLASARLAKNSYYKNILVNAAQATVYEVRAEKPIDTNEVQMYSESDLRKRDHFRLRVYASSRDSKLFERIDSIADYYSLTLLDRIQDSLYRNREDRHMKPYEFLWEAERIQDKSDDTRAYEISNLLMEDRNNPIVPCIMLKTHELEKNMEAYTKLYNTLPAESKSNKCAIELSKKFKLK